MASYLMDGRDGRPRVANKDGAHSIGKVSPLEQRRLFAEMGHTHNPRSPRSHKVRGRVASEEESGRDASCDGLLRGVPYVLSPSMKGGSTFYNLEKRQKCRKEGFERSALLMFGFCDGGDE